MVDRVVAVVPDDARLFTMSRPPPPVEGPRHREPGGGRALPVVPVARFVLVGRRRVEPVGSGRRSRGHHRCERSVGVVGENGDVRELPVVRDDRAKRRAGGTRRRRRHRPPRRPGGPQIVHWPEGLVKIRELRGRPHRRPDCETTRGCRPRRCRQSMFGDRFFTVDARVNRGSVIPRNPLLSRVSERCHQDSLRTNEIRRVRPPSQAEGGLNPPGPRHPVPPRQWAFEIRSTTGLEVLPRFVGGAREWWLGAPRSNPAPGCQLVKWFPTRRSSPEGSTGRPVAREACAAVLSDSYCRC